MRYSGKWKDTFKRFKNGKHGKNSLKFMACDGRNPNGTDLFNSLFEMIQTDGLNDWADLFVCFSFDMLMFGVTAPIFITTQQSPVFATKPPHSPASVLSTAWNRPNITRGASAPGAGRSPISRPKSTLLLYYVGTLRHILFGRGPVVSALKWQSLPHFVLTDSKVCAPVFFFASRNSSMQYVRWHLTDRYSFFVEVGV